MVRLGVLGVLVVLSAGCDLKAFTVSTTAPVLKLASESFAAENDVQLAREAAPGQLKTVEGFLQSSPQNRDLLHVLAQGYVEYAFGFLEDDLDAMPDDLKHAEDRKQLAWRATNLYDRALDYSLKLLALDDKQFPEQFRKDVASSDAAGKRLGKKQAPGMLFAGLSLASAINLNRDDLSRVVDLPKAIALVKRSHELDPGFYNAGAAMTLGIIYCSQGKAIGGDPDQGQKMFEEALATTHGKYLMINVMYARYFGVITQNRPLFEQKLKEVLAAPADLFPQQRLANTLAKKRAKRYLDHVEDYF